MKDLLIEYKQQILLIAAFLTLPFTVFIISLAGVYLCGRMFGFLTKPQYKNILAFLVMVMSYAFYFKYIQIDITVVQSIWYAVIYCSISIIFYVLIGFKLYSRIDNFLDRKIAPDSDDTINITKSTKIKAKKR